MSARALVALLLAAGGLGVAWILFGHASGSPSDAAEQTLTPPEESKSAGTPAPKIQTPEAETAKPSVRTDAKLEPLTPKDQPPEAVEPLLILNLIVAGGAADSSPDAVKQQVDELLNAKHAGKTTVQLERYFHSIEAVLELQKNQKTIPTEQILSPDAINALGIEATWLKERVFP